jgi:hypothetical protein
MKFRRGKLEINRWLAKFQLMTKRLSDSWMDTFGPIDEHKPLSPDDDAEIKAHLRATQVDTTNFDALAYQSHSAALKKELHRKEFPFNENLMALLFYIQSDLTDQQRTLLTAHLELKNIKPKQYKVSILRDLYLDLLSAPKSGLDDPNRRPRDFGYRERSFTI